MQGGRSSAGRGIRVEAFEKGKGVGKKGETASGLVGGKKKKLCANIGKS